MSAFRAGYCWLVLGFALLVFPLTGRSEPPAAVDSGALTKRIEEVLRERGHGVVASVWLGGPTGSAWFSYKADVARPTASSIKTAYLVELFARYAGHLDEPLPGLDKVLQDDAHPAIAHFPAAERGEIRKQLLGATPRRIGEVMIGRTTVSNVVYNVGANATTAVLGGPVALSKLIHDRDPTFAAIHARRYMLAARDVTGDNEATAAALAAVLQRLASGRLAGIDPETSTAIRRVLLTRDTPKLGKHFSKDGSLNTDPMVRVRSGWWEMKEGSFVYVVMLSQPGPGDEERGTAASRLDAACTKITDLVVAEARRMLAPVANEKRP